MAGDNRTEIVGATKRDICRAQRKDRIRTDDAKFLRSNTSPEHRGAIFFAVCRGKASEGVDFSDNNGRAVLIVDIPFPPTCNPKVKLKEQYLE